MSELVELAQRARLALAEARSVTLLIQGVGPVPANSPAVLLHDRDGRPTFFCEPGSLVGPAGRRGSAALLSLPIGEDETPRAVVLGGRLVRVGVEAVDGVPVEVVALEPDRVIVECDDPDRSVVRQYVVPLELYRQAAPDPLAEAARRIVAHTNECHPRELLRFVAARTATPAGELAGATLTALDADRAQVQWVDGRGSHTLHLEFPARAGTARELGDRLRDGLAPLAAE